MSVDPTAGMFNALGCTHATELDFVFGCAGCGPFFSKPFANAAESGLAEDMSSKWANFAITKDPNKGPNSSRGSWNNYLLSRELFVLGSDTRTGSHIVEQPRWCSALNPTWFVRSARDPRNRQQEEEEHFKEEL